MTKTFAKIASVVAFISISLCSWGQRTTIISNDFSYTSTYQYVAAPGAREFYSNFIIQEIARSIPKRAEYTSFTLNYVMNQQLIKLDSAHYVFKPELKNFTATGDVLYKGINIAKKLIPGEIDYTVKVYRKQSGGMNIGGQQNGVLVFQKTVTGQQLNDNLGYFPLPELAFSDTVNDAQYTLAVENQVLYFNEKSKNNFLNQVAYINDYYATDALIAAQMDKLHAIQPDNIDLISFYDIELKEVEQTIASIDSRQFPQNLGLHENDPMQFMPKMQSLVSQTAQMRATLNQRLSVLDQLFCQKGNDLMAEGKLQEAANYYNKSIQVNPYYAPAEYQLARMAYNSGNYDTSAYMVNYALLKMSPDPSTQQLLVQLGNTLYSTMIGTGDKYNSEEQFNEAIASFERAKWLCSSTPGMVCTEQVTKGLAQARYGIYHSYLMVAEKAIQNGRLDIAGIYINQSMEYQKQNSAEIISNSESIQWMGILCKEYVMLGNTLNQKKQYDQAIIEFNKCDSISKVYPTIGEVKGCKSGLCGARNGVYNNMLDGARSKLSTDQLDAAEEKCNQAIAYQHMYKDDIASDREAVLVMSGIKEKRYHIAIANGKNYLNGNNHADAAKYFLEARGYHQEYNFRRNDSLEIYIRTAGKPLVAAIVEEGKVQAWGNKLGEARESYQKATDAIKLYGLEKDKELDASMLELKNKIFSQECANAEQSYLSFLDKSKKLMRDGDYALAYVTLTQAIDVTSKNVLCNIDNSAAYKEQNRIKPAMEYQNLMFKVDEYAAQGNYTECLKQINTCGIFYTTNGIDSFGLKHPTPQEYILRGGDVNFVYFGADYFYGLKDYESAFKMLQELKNRSYPVKFTKTIQTQLGGKMAIRDKINGVTDYKIQILKYTEGEKWYAVFSKAYKKSWKKN